MQIVIVCSAPGLFVAGRAHPRVEAYAVTEFSEAQLRELLADRHITVTVGKKLTADDVAAFIAEHNPPVPEPAKSAKSAKAGA